MDTNKVVYLTPDNIQKHRSKIMDELKLRVVEDMLISMLNKIFIYITFI